MLRSSSLPAVALALALAVVAMAPRARALATGCCECAKCEGPTQCFDTVLENDCPTRCSNAGCGAEAFNLGLSCSVITPCEAAAGATAGVPAMDAIGLSLLALAAGTAGVHRLRRRRRSA
jgi:hypothetical protein